MRHTEGGRYITVRGANGHTVARVPWSSDTAGERGEATDHNDALLIALAPEMLRGLEEIRDTIAIFPYDPDADKLNVDWGVMHDWIDSLIRRASI